MTGIGEFTEKYRPIKFEDLVGNHDVIEKISKLANHGNIPHTILEGPSGVGKTTIALLIAQKLFEDNWRSNFIEYNVAGKGVNFVRDELFHAARSVPFESNFKIIYLDEADTLNKGSQDELSRIIEKHSNITRFVLSVNNIKELLPKIISRFQLFHLDPISPQEMIPRLEYICDNEGLTCTQEELLKIAVSSQGDMRKAIHEIQVLVGIK